MSKKSKNKKTRHRDKSANQYNIKPLPKNNIVSNFLRLEEEQIRKYFNSRMQEFLSATVKPELLEQYVLEVEQSKDYQHEVNNAVRYFRKNSQYNLPKELIEVGDKIGCADFDPDELSKIIENYYNDIIATSNIKYDLEKCLRPIMTGIFEVTIGLSSAEAAKYLAMRVTQVGIETICTSEKLREFEETEVRAYVYAKIRDKYKTTLKHEFVEEYVIKHYESNKVKNIINNILIEIRSINAKNNKLNGFIKEYQEKLNLLKDSEKELLDVRNNIEVLLKKLNDIKK